MSRLTVVVLLILVVAIAGGAVFLLTWDIPPPTRIIEKIVPNDRFQD
jgi:hypothetical protein